MEVSSQNGLGCCSSWFKFVVSGKQDLQSLIDPIGQTRHFVLIETEKNPLEFANVIKTWITCRTYTRGIQNFLFILLRKRDFGPVRLSRVTMMHFFSPTKILFFPQSNFHPLFLNEDGRIRGKRPSKLHYQFRRYQTLPWTILLESQYLQSYDSLPDFLRPKFEEVRHNFADIEIQAKLS